MSRLINSIPKVDGYIMPGEFHSHSGCWMLWPHRPDIWRLHGKPAQLKWVDLAVKIAEFETVNVGVNADHFSSARRMLPEHISVVEMPYDDVWVRDSGPTIVVNAKNGSLRGVDWNFDAWGELYSPYDQDQALPSKILRQEKLDRYKCNQLTIEGGAFHVDGEGTLISTKKCVLARNPDLTLSEIELLLQQYLGVESIIWLEEGLKFDETGGHVDNICAFVEPSVVVVNWTDDPKNPQYDICNSAVDILSRSRDAKGRSFRIYKIHQPSQLQYTAEECEGLQSIEGTIARQPGDPLVASYINIYIANNGVIVPTFDDKSDIDALNTFSKLFPNRRIVPIESREILLGGGNVHCITQQIPYPLKL